MKRLQLLLLFALIVPLAAAPEKKPPTESDPADEMLEAGSRLFDELAPPQIKRQFEFPSKERWNEFVARLQSALDHSSLEDLAAYEPEARAALAAARAWPEFAEYVDWLEERLDYIEGARQAVRTPPPPPGVTLPFYGMWLKRVQARPRPPRADEFMPQLREIFTVAGLPAELPWQAEVESSFNPEARSPAGARGLFQLMPATARELGLSALMPDERADPGKNARAAAAYLRQLHGKFGDWPLALAAYNAGPGRISRTLAARQAKTFAAIADQLPAETRMYVPKVLATMAVRTGRPPEKLLAPK